MPSIMFVVQVYEFNVPTFGKGVVFDVDHKVGPCHTLSTSHAQAKATLSTCKNCCGLTEQHKFFF